MKMISRMKNKFKIGDKFHIDTGDIPQYENERIVDDVEVVDTPKKYSKTILVYSKKLRANILVKKRELK